MNGGTRLRYEDLPALAGGSFDAGSFRVTREERDTFERVTWVDRAYPDPDPPEFPADIVEGFHTLALLDAVTASVHPLDAGSVYGFNYGLDRVRFTAPIRIGDLVHASFDVPEVRPRGEGLLLLRRCTLTVDGDDRPALLADWWIFCLRSQSRDERL